MDISPETLAWLQEGDPAIRWQAQRDLLGQPDEQERARVATEGWGADLLSRQTTDGHWGVVPQFQAQRNLHQRHDFGAALLFPFPR